MAAVGANSSCYYAVIPPTISDRQYLKHLDHMEIILIKY